MDDPGEYTHGYDAARAAAASRTLPRRSRAGLLIVAGILGLLLLAGGFVLGAVSAGSDAPRPVGNVTLDRRLSQVTVTESVARVTVVVTR